MTIPSSKHSQEEQPNKILILPVLPTSPLPATIHPCTAHGGRITSKSTFWDIRWTEFDAIVLGSFNLYDSSYKNAALWQGATNYSRAHPEQQIPLGGRPGITLPKLVKAYDGPIVALSGFLSDHNLEHNRNVQTIQDVALRTGRTNLRAINSRAPLEAVAKTGCTNNAGVVMECQSSGSHQCVGHKGGIPDLVAWDVVEAFYELLS